MSNAPNRYSAATTAARGRGRPSATDEGSLRARQDRAITFHILRHTWASLAVMAGVPLMVVAKHLGYAVSLRACLAQVGSEQQAGILAGLQGPGRSAHHYHVLLRRVW